MDLDITLSGSSAGTLPWPQVGHSQQTNVHFEHPAPSLYNVQVASLLSLPSI